MLSDFDFSVTGFLFSPFFDKIVVIRGQLPKTIEGEPPTLIK